MHSTPCTFKTQVPLELEHDVLGLRVVVQVPWTIFFSMKSIESLEYQVHCSIQNRKMAVQQLQCRIIYASQSN